MTAPFLRRLADHCGTRTGAIPVWNGQLEPLVAIYPNRCHLLARECLLSGRRAVRDFAKVCLREGALNIFTPSQTDAPCFHNWNSPSDLDRSPAEALTQRALRSPTT